MRSNENRSIRPQLMARGVIMRDAEENRRDKMLSRDGRKLALGAVFTTAVLAITGITLSHRQQERAIDTLLSIPTATPEDKALIMRQIKGNHDFSCVTFRAELVATCEAARAESRKYFFEYPFVP